MFISLVMRGLSSSETSHYVLLNRVHIYRNTGTSEVCGGNSQVWLQDAVYTVRPLLAPAQMVEYYHKE
jgi:hypothetical protein